MELVLAVGILTASLALAFIFDRIDLLKIYSAPQKPVLYKVKPREPPEEKAIFKLNKILEAEIPGWMGKPPINYAIAILVVCVSLSAVILAVSVLIKAVK